MITQLGGRAHLAALIHEIRQDAPAYLMIAVYIAVGLLHLRAVGYLDGVAIGAYIQPWLFIFAFVLPSIATGIGATRIVVFVRKRRLLAIRLMFSVRRTSRFVAGILLLFAIGAFVSTFTPVKMSLSSQSGFVWDRWFADFDRLLGLGYDPWIVLHQLLPAEVHLSFIEFNYNVGWFLACWTMMFWVATSPKAQDMRNRFVACFLLVWAVLGSVLASIFISAGPIFYAAVTGDTERFAGLIAELRRNAEIPTSVFAYHLYLWEAHESGNVAMGTGISAFPSVHVGLIVMCALFADELDHRFGIVAILYAAFIMMSSVYLGWHYAVDGYAAIAVVLVIYRLAKLVPYDRLVVGPAIYRPAIRSAAE